MRNKRTKEEEEKEEEEWGVRWGRLSCDSHGDGIRPDLGRDEGGDELSLRAGDQTQHSGPQTQRLVRIGGRPEVGTCSDAVLLLDPGVVVQRGVWVCLKDIR